MSQLEPDEGRDLLVARHIAVFGERPLIGHWTAGISDFRYGPYYYYLLSLINTLGDSPYFIFMFFTIWHSLSTVFLFFIGKNFVNEKVGKITALLYAASYIMIVTNNIWSAYFSFQLIILSFFFFSFYYKTKKNYYLYTHILFLTLSVGTQYANIILLPGFILWSFLIGKKSLKKTEASLFLLFKNAGMYFGALLLSFLPHIFYYKSELLDVAENFMRDSNTISVRFFIQIMAENLQNIFRQLFKFPTRSLLYIGILIMVWVYVCLRRRALVRENLLLVATMFFSSLVVASLFTTSVQIYYLLSLYIFIFLGFGIIVNALTKSGVIQLILIMPILVAIFRISPRYAPHAVGNPIERVDTISGLISDNIKESDYQIIDDFSILQNSNVSHRKFFSAPEFYLFLEYKLDRKLVNIVYDTEFNIEEPNGKKYIFLVCRKYLDRNLQFVSCLDNFYENYDNYALDKTVYHSSFGDAYLFSKLDR